MKAQGRAAKTGNKSGGWGGAFKKVKEGMIEV